MGGWVGVLWEGRGGMENDGRSRKESLACRAGILTLLSRGKKAAPPHKRKERSGEARCVALRCGALAGGGRGPVAAATR